MALAGKLSEEGYVVSVYDPLAMAGAETMLSDRVMFANDAADALEEVQVAVVTTPWPQFKETVLWTRRTRKRSSSSSILGASWNRRHSPRMSHWCAWDMARRQSRATW